MPKFGKKGCQLARRRFHVLFKNRKSMESYFYNIKPLKHRNALARVRLPNNSLMMVKANDASYWTKRIKIFGMCYWSLKQNAFCNTMFFIWKWKKNTSLSMPENTQCVRACVRLLESVCCGSSVCKRYDRICFMEGVLGIGLFIIFGCLIICICYFVSASFTIFLN